jgi:hypothetical protein
VWIYVHPIRLCINEFARSQFSQKLLALSH